MRSPVTPLTVTPWTGTPETVQANCDCFFLFASQGVFVKPTVQGRTPRCDDSDQVLTSAPSAAGSKHPKDQDPRLRGAHPTNVAFEHTDHENHCGCAKCSTCSWPQPPTPPLMSIPMIPMSTWHHHRAATATSPLGLASVLTDNRRRRHPIAPAPPVAWSPVAVDPSANKKFQNRSRCRASNNHVFFLSSGNGTFLKFIYCLS